MPWTSRADDFCNLPPSAPLASTAAAQAETYPTGPLRLVVGFPAGGPNDILARLIAEWLGARRSASRSPVDNQPGQLPAASTTGAVAGAAPDGDTLLLVGPANAISAALPQKLDFVFLRDIAPVAGITREPLVLLVHPAVWRPDWSVS